MLTFEKNDDVAPVCPHCKAKIESIWYRDLKGDLGKRCVYFCSSCHAVIGISHRKGLTMGM
jgi:hypothetical protein